MKIQFNLDSFFRWILGFGGVALISKEADDISLIIMYLGLCLGVEAICYLAHYDTYFKNKNRKK